MTIPARPEFSLIPFWFWNDDLAEEEILRQMEDFIAHGVHGFVIHPRVGLPKEIGWMSRRMLHFVRFAVEEAARLGMKVVLYDEGMYPSGSSSGQVVAANPAHQVRGLSAVPGTAIPPDATVLATVARNTGEEIAIVERRVQSTIRGLHYLGEGPEEEAPSASDLLNPEAVASFIHLVYDRFFETVGDHFGKTVIGIFTDEPSLLGRCWEKEIHPGTTDILSHVNRFLGYDFTPHLPALWFDDEPDAERYRAEYYWAVHRRMEETYYGQLQAWCLKHHTILMGHPDEPDAIGLERYFGIPGQDIVWRWVLPGNGTGLEGAQSTQAKCSASAMLHLGLRRNSNECFGAYGHELTFDETRWIINWCLVRGVNMFFPHAFYYSQRGLRRDERPPDVGPNSAWWEHYKGFADACARLCEINTDSTHVCNIAILGLPDHLPWKAAKVLYQNQRDFNYLEVRHLWEDAVVDESGIRLRGMHYQVLIVDDLPLLPPQAGPFLSRLAAAGRLLLRGRIGADLGGVAFSEETLVSQLASLAAADLCVSPAAPDLRYRHVIKNGTHFHFLFNEGMATLTTTLEIPGPIRWLDPATGIVSPASDGGPLVLQPWEMKVALS